jgi:LysM repeat protein
MRTSRPSRILAPLALGACVLAVAIVALSSLGGDDSATQLTAATQTTARTSTSSRSGSGTTRRTYTVKSGDSLSLIAEKTGVPVEELIRLNPGVDPQSLRTGQKLKLKES